jgi:hypothetical protein
MTEFMTWLRVEMLRLRSFDWRSGSWGIHWLKENGVAKFSSYYNTRELAAKIGCSEDELLSVMESPSVLNELDGKSFTVSWKDVGISLNWLEEGISEWKTDINQHYYEEDGKFYSDYRITDKIIYLDGTERVVKDTGSPARVSITEVAFKDALEQIRRSSGK